MPPKLPPQVENISWVQQMEPFLHSIMYHACSPLHLQLPVSYALSWRLWMNVLSFILWFLPLCHVLHALLTCFHKFWYIWCVFLFFFFYQIQAIGRVIKHKIFQNQTEIASYKIWKSDHTRYSCGKRCLSPLKEKKKTEIHEGIKGIVLSSVN